MKICSRNLPRAKGGLQRSNRRRGEAGEAPPVAGRRDNVPSVHVCYLLIVDIVSVIVFNTCMYWEFGGVLNATVGLGFGIAAQATHIAHA